MSDADRAYSLAQDRIFEKKKRGDEILELDSRNHEEFRALDRLPPEIAELGELQKLKLSGTQVASLPSLAGLNALQSLDLSQTPISDLSPLRDLNGLHSLHLANTAVKDLAPLAALNALGNLSLAGSPITDLSPLEQLKALRSLDLSNTQVSEIGPLAGLTELNTLNLSNTQVSDLRPIARLEKLENGGGLHFKDIPVIERDPKLAELVKIENHARRAKETLAYLRSLPPWPEPYTPSESTLPKSGTNDASRDRNKGVATGFLTEQVKKLNAEVADLRSWQKRSQEASERLSSFDETAEELENRILKASERAAEQEKLLSDLRKKLAEFKADAEQQITDTDKAYRESMDAAKAAFSADLAQAEPVELWERKQEEHERSRKWAFLGFVGGLVVVLGLVAVLICVLIKQADMVQQLFAPIGCDLQRPETCSGFSLRGWLAVAGVLTLFTISLWFARLQMKLYLAERHLVLDARERCAFAQTYIGLLKLGDTSPEAQEQRAMVYAALFRPASDGTVKEEGGLDPAIAAALSKFLSR